MALTTSASGGVPIDQTQRVRRSSLLPATDTVCANTQECDYQNTLYGKSFHRYLMFSKRETLINLRSETESVRRIPQYSRTDTRVDGLTGALSLLLPPRLPSMCIGP
jgi:hypothetical protein